jgi:hypothetical protein
MIVRLLTPGGTVNEYCPGEVNVAVADVAACAGPAAGQASANNAPAQPSIRGLRVHADL